MFQFLFTVGLSICSRPWAISFSRLIEIGGPSECDQKLTPGSVFQFLFTVGLSIRSRPWAISFSKMIEIGGPSECGQKLTPGSVFQILFTVCGTTFLRRVGF